MLTEDAEESNSISTSGCGQPISGANFSRECEEQTAEGGSAAYRWRDTIGPLKFAARGGVSGSYDAFVMPKIDEDSDEEDEELSECEWEGWTRDLNRQDKAERSRQAKEANRRQQQAATAAVPFPMPCNHISAAYRRTHLPRLSHILSSCATSPLTSIDDSMAEALCIWYIDLTVNLRNYVIRL
jgi:hypothetical protein